MSHPHPELTDSLLKDVLIRRAAGARTSTELVEDVLTAVEALPQGHRWSLPLAQQPRLLPLLLAAGLLLVTVIAGALIAGAQPFRRDLDDVLLRRGFAEPFIGLPPQGAAPSVPETGELVLTFDGRVHGLAMDVHVMWLYADGRLIWKRNLDGVNPGSAEARRGWGATEPTTAVLEQRLTPEGAELLRSEVESDAVPGIGSAKRGVFWGGLAFHDGRQLVAAGWSDPELPMRLADPASWLPARAWLDRRIGGYVPSWYAVCVEREDLLPERAQAMLRARSTGIAEIAIPGGGPCPYRVTTEDARSIAVTLDQAGLQRDDSWGVLAYRMPDVSFISILPHGEAVAYGG